MIPTNDIEVYIPLSLTKIMISAGSTINGNDTIHAENHRGIADMPDATVPPYMAKETINDSTDAKTGTTVSLLPL